MTKLMKEEKKEMFQKNKIDHRWKGDNITHHGLCEWIRERIIKPKACQHCGITGEQLLLTNITGIFNRDLSNWDYLCHGCHLKVRKTKLQIEISNRVCSECGRNQTTPSTNNRPLWYRDKQTGMIICKTCYESAIPKVERNMMETVRHSIDHDQYDKFHYLRKFASRKMLRDLASGNITIDEAYNKLRNK